MPSEQKRDIVFIHGIQIGDDEALGDYSKRVKTSLESRDNVAVNTARCISTYWASVAEEHTEKWEERAKSAVELFTGPLGVLAGPAVKALIDLVGDVFIYRLGTAATEIRKAVRDQLKEASNPIVVAHSLGSVIAYDLLEEDINAGKYSGPKDKWPFRGMVTFGSPLNLSLFYEQRRKRFSKEFSDWFDWYNLSDKNDPVVTGNVFGIADSPMLFERYENHATQLNIRDRFANSGFHVSAHTSYWQHPTVTRCIAKLVTR